MVGPGKDYVTSVLEVRIDASSCALCPGHIGPMRIALTRFFKESLELCFILSGTILENSH